MYIFFIAIKPSFSYNWKNWVLLWTMFWNMWCFTFFNAYKNRSCRSGKILLMII